MPRPGLRTDRFRRIVRKTPGGVLVIHYKRKSPGRPRCAVCRKPLSGKRPKRPYGGNLCPRCSRERIKSLRRLASVDISRQTEGAKALKGGKQ